MAPQVLVGPGVFGSVSNGAGSTQEVSEVSINWSIATNGMAQYTRRYVLWNTIQQFGKPPYAHCALSGFLYPVAEMVTVDGKRYGPEYAPTSKFQL